MCRAHGWGPGTVITSAGQHGIVTLRITAVGEVAILARGIGPSGETSRETVWNSLDHRFWREAVTA